jgi:hypothetical protein
VRRRSAKYRARRARRLRVVRAAIRHRGHVYSLPQPARHYHVMHLIWDSRGHEYVGMDQGFTLNDGQYVDRQTAHRVAKRAGQLIPREGGYRSGEVNDRDGSDLFSEDVW